MLTSWQLHLTKMILCTILFQHSRSVIRLWLSKIQHWCGFSSQSDKILFGHFIIKKTNVPRVLNKKWDEFYLSQKILIGNCEMASELEQNIHIIWDFWSPGAVVYGIWNCFFNVNSIQSGWKVLISLK